MYWLTSSAFSLSQIMLLKLPSFRTAMGIPALVRHPEQAPKPDVAKQGMFATIKESTCVQMVFILLSLHLLCYLHCQKYNGIINNICIH